MSRGGNGGGGGEQSQLKDAANYTTHQNLVHRDLISSYDPLDEVSEDAEIQRSGIGGGSHNLRQDNAHSEPKYSAHTPGGHSVGPRSGLRKSLEGQRRRSTKTASVAVDPRHRATSASSGGHSNRSVALSDPLQMRLPSPIGGISPGMTFPHLPSPSITFHDLP